MAKKRGRKKRYTPSLKSVRAAIDRALERALEGKKHASKRKAANQAATTKADRIVQQLTGARAMMEQICCQDDQNCPFDVI